MKYGRYGSTSHMAILRNNDYILICIHVHTHTCVYLNCVALGGSLRRMRSVVPKIPFTLALVFHLMIAFIYLQGFTSVRFQVQIKVSLIVLEMSHNILIAHFSEDLGQVKFLLNSSLSPVVSVLGTWYCSLSPLALKYITMPTVTCAEIQSWTKKVKESQKKPFFHAWILIMRVVISLQPFVFMPQEEIS